MVGQEIRVTAAHKAASKNWNANLRALAVRQPALAESLDDLPPELEWVFGRDGSLTARVFGGWWSGCSLPRRAAESVLARMELKGPVACFVGPTHSAQVRVALERMQAGQALVVVIPDTRDLRIALGCEDFAAQIEAGRLWFVTGEAWGNDLARLLSEHEGLPTPGQFIRTNLTEAEIADALIAAADAVIQRENARRAEVVRSIFASGERSSAAQGPGHGTVLAAVGSQFRLWDDAGEALRQVALASGWRVVDVDQPCSASAVAFARAVAGCRGVVLANASRVDLPASLGANVRVISWLTAPRIPAFDPRGARDGLILADPSWRDAALAAGWQAARIAVAAWPPSTVAASGGKGLALIADTWPHTAPEFDRSSHRLLWDTIASELSADPFAVGRDAGAYLARWCARAGIDEQTLDRRLFIERLIVPAYQQGLARILLVAGIELRLLGRGWDRVEDLAHRHCGEVRGRSELRAAVESTGGLVHAWPTNWAHPIDACGKPVLRPNKTQLDWLQEARRLAAGEGGTAPLPSAMSLNAPVIESLLDR